MACLPARAHQDSAPSTEVWRAACQASPARPAILSMDARTLGVGGGLRCPAAVRVPLLPWPLLSASLCGLSPLLQCELFGMLEATGGFKS